MTQLLDVRPDPAPTDRAHRAVATGRIVVYGDFNCPWSYLASRRAAILSADGVAVDWRAVTHEQKAVRRTSDSGTRFACVREEMDRVLAALVPDEVLPYSLAGFVPYTRAAVTGYAEAYAAGVAMRVRHLLFEAFWLHAVDLDDPALVRTLLVDAIQSGSSPSEPLAKWGYSVDWTGGPITTPGWRLITGWADEWRSTGKEVVPALFVDGRPPLFGVDAVEWLGAEILDRGLDPRVVPMPPPTRRPSPGDLTPASWASQHGNRWMRDYQQVHRHRRFPFAG
jgi:hypothetical protein